MTVLERFAGVVGALREGGLCWVEEDEAWWVYDQGSYLWKRDGGLAERTATALALAEAPDRLPGKFVREALAWAKTDDSLRRSVLDFDADPRVVNTPLGPIDLRTHESARYEPRCTKSLAAAPGASAGSLWRSFLEEAVPDEDARLWLQLWAGTLLAGDTDSHCLLFIYGPGGTGKSLFAETLLHVLGTYASVIPADVLVGSRGSDGAYWKAALKGLRLAVVNETGEGDYWNAPQAKALSGGDLVHARNPYGRPFAFTPSHKLLVVSNDPPQLSKVDDAFRRRMAVVRFDRKPKNPEPRMKHMLHSEAAAVLGWMHEGLIGLEEQLGGRLMDAMPGSIRASTDAYFEEVDVVGEWLAEATETDWSHVTSSKFLYADYRRFCEDRGRKAKSWPNLRHDLVEREAIRVRRTGRAREIIGLRVADDLGGIL